MIATKICYLLRPGALGVRLGGVTTAGANVLKLNTLPEYLVPSYVPVNWK